MLGRIYLITNTSNGKKYVGQTVQSGRRRFLSHKRSAFKYQSSLPIHRAIRKYGIDNFRYEVLEECNSMDDLNSAESRWILELDTFGPNGYNCTTGGEGFIVSDETRQKISLARAGIKLSEDHCKAMSVAMTGESNPFYGKTHSEETIAQIKETLKGQMDGENNPFYGKRHSEESLKKMSESHIGKQVGEKHPRSKLTEKDVLEIRAAAQNGIGRRVLAEKYGVGKTAIDKIVKRDTWKHI
jgi:group I intron endonuclease